MANGFGRGFAQGFTSSFRGGESFIEGMKERRERKEEQEKASKLGKVVKELDLTGADKLGVALEEGSITPSEAISLAGVLQKGKPDATELAILKAIGFDIGTLPGTTTDQADDLATSRKRIARSLEGTGKPSIVDRGARPYTTTPRDFLTASRTIKAGPLSIKQEDPAFLEYKKELDVRATQRKKEVEDIYKSDRLMPKMEYLNEVGAGSYREVLDVLERNNIPLKPGRGANAIAFGIAMDIMDKFEVVSLKDSVKKMKLEVGTELMRTLGAFRNPLFAKEFGQTLGEFHGNPYQDIENVATTFTKSIINVMAANKDLTGLSREESKKELQKAEAMAYYQFSKRYVDLGIIPSFHFGQLQPEEVVERLDDFITSHDLYKEAKSKFPDMDEDELKLKFFMKGAKEGWL